jgi:hypothetical protein
MAGAIALALGGSALANTNLDDTSTGDVFINVVDTSNNTSFLYDTGQSQATFNLSKTQSFSFATNANYEAFVAAEGSSDVIDFSVLSGTKTSATPAVGTVLFTSNGSPLAVTGAAVSQALTNMGGFFTVANGVTASGTGSAYLNAASSATWGQAQFEGAVTTNLGVPYTTPGSGDSALVGSSIAFYEETSGALRSTSTPATLTLEKGTWTEVAGVATYTVAGTTVPLPTPVLLLLSGLGLMGVVGRRRKGEAVDSMGGAAA